MKPTNDDVCLRDEKTLSPSNSKLKRGVPVWFSGKVSPAFEKHIFWPSPEKKCRKCERKLTELFPACASSQEWRNLYKQKELSRSKGIGLKQILTLVHLQSKNGLRNKRLDQANAKRRPDLKTNRKTSR